MGRRGGAKRQKQTHIRMRCVEDTLAGYDKFNSCVCSSAYLVTPNTWSRVDLWRDCSIIVVKASIILHVTRIFIRIFIYRIFLAKIR